MEEFYSLFQKLKDQESGRPLTDSALICIMQEVIDEQEAYNEKVRKDMDIGE